MPPGIDPALRYDWYSIMSGSRNSLQWSIIFSFSCSNVKTGGPEVILISAVVCLSIELRGDWYPLGGKLLVSCTICETFMRC